MKPAENKKFSTLKKKSEFEALKKNGKRIPLRPWLTLNVLKNRENELRVGYTISRKVGSAVVRNKLKRWCRESLKALAHDQKPGVDINVVFRPREEGFYKSLSYSDLYEAWSDNWQKIIRTN